MAPRAFGHVGDGPALTPAKAIADAVPHFDQLHVDYLKHVFAIGSPCPILAKSVDDAVAVVAWVNQDQGNRDVISHIESIIAAQKANGR